MLMDHFDGVHRTGMSWNVQTGDRQCELDDIRINGKVWGYYWQSMGYDCIFVQSMGHYRREFRKMDKVAKGARYDRR